MNQYKTIVIGAGSIGALKPNHIDYPGSPNILTHCNSVQRHPATELTAIIDTDSEQLLKANAKWNPKAIVYSYDELISVQGTPDIVIVAVPTDLHHEIISEVLDSQPKLIIAEKPFCHDHHSANDILSQQKEKTKDGRRYIPIAIDYIRRYANEYKNIKKHIDSGRFGKALNCRVLYARGLFHEGCHAIDLMRYFFGECIGTDDNLLYDVKINDRNLLDPTRFKSLYFIGCQSVIFQPCDGRKYGIFEVDICFENCRIRFIDNGLYIERYPINEENEWGHKSLDYSLSNVLRTETGLNTALYGLIDNGVNFLDGKEDLFCTSEDAIAVHQILDGLK